MKMSANFLCIESIVKSPSDESTIVTIKNKKDRKGW